MKKGEDKRPTMTDVARIAGVSQSSVSLVLNDMPGSRISSDTRTRVLDAAKSIGYALPSVRNEAARSPMPSRDKIAFVVDEISTSPHPVVSFDGVRDHAFEQGLIAAAYTTRSNPTLEDQVMRSILSDSSVVGVIYATIFTRRVTLPEALRDLPVVGCVAAIGFTVALFVASVAFPAGPVQDAAKMVALFSLGSAVLAIIAGRLARIQRMT